MKIREEFLGFEAVVNQTGDALCNIILQKLTDFGLAVEFLRGQSYDGGANMSGSLRGVQARIIEQQPLALYTHCASHRLNLVISKACSVPVIRNTLQIITELTNFIRQSSKRVQLMKEKISEHDPEEKRLKLKSLCETRWVERHDAILQFKDMYNAIVSFLEIITDIAGQGSTFLHAITKFEFIIALEILTTFFGQLQNPAVEIYNCYDIIQIILEKLQHYRNTEECYNNVFEKAVNVAEEHEIPVTMPRTLRKQVYRANITSQNPKEYFRLNVFLPFLDFFVAELSNRFSPEQHRNIMILSRLIPGYITKDFKDGLINAALFYKADLPGTISEMEAEFDLWEQYWLRTERKDRPCTAIEAFQFTLDNQFYPNIKELLHILCVIPVTTSTAERSFSTLRRVKTYLRSTMGEA